MKIQKKNFFFLGGGVGDVVRGVGQVGGCQGGWERRIEAFVKIQKKKNIFFRGGGRVGGSGRGGKGGCEWRSEAFVKIQKKIFFGWGVVGGWGTVSGGGGGWVGLGGVRVDGNGELKLL